MGSNLYDRYIKRLHARTGNQINGNFSEETTSKDPDHDPELADSRNMPPGTKFHKQTVKDFMGLLVCTGVYPKFYFPSFLQLTFVHGHFWAYKNGSFFMTRRALPYWFTDGFLPEILETFPPDVKNIKFTESGSRFFFWSFLV